ncbi:MAG TPA: efflux RND transporter periplasmic adaptor subunit [Pirellulaceae bacterium]|nr:efflux RND transporter periplasmic adaptor subunit [Pirellulaceae bacterium]
MARFFYPSTATLWLLPLVFSFVGCGFKEAKKPDAPPPPKVLFVKPIKDEVIEEEEFTGRTAAVETVAMRARVSGYLDKVLFQDGADVKKGQVLFKIDDRPFVAEEARTAAAVAQFEARVNRLQLQLKRSEELYDKQAISQDEFETIKFDRAEAEASLNGAKASHEIAKLNLAFTQVKAPISGRIGRRMVDEGNLVTADITSLATIVPLDKVYIYFDMDERTVLKLRRLISDGVIQSPDKEDVTVKVALADSPEFALSGVIDFQDNQVDPATGTLRVRATVKNPYGLLSPGLFARILYPIGKPSPSLLIPEESLGSDQGQPFVYVIGDDNQVVFRRVELGPQREDERVIRKGVEAHDRVVVTGLQRLRRNDKVTPEERPADVEKPAETVAAKLPSTDKAAKGTRFTAVPDSSKVAE